MCLSFKMKWRVVVLNGTGLSLSDPLRGSHMYKLPSSLQLTPHVDVFWINPGKTHVSKLTIRSISLVLISFSHKFSVDHLLTYP